MLLIIQAYLEILFFRRGPDAIPASMPLFGLTFAVDGALTVFVIAALGGDPVIDLLGYFIGLIMLFSIVWLLLNALQLEGRFLQTATAILGADALLTVIQLMVALGGADLQAVRDVSDAPISLFALVLINLWWFAVVGFVVKKAGSLNLLAAIGVVFSVYVLTRGASDLLLG